MRLAKFYDYLIDLLQAMIASKQLSSDAFKNF